MRTEAYEENDLVLLDDFRKAEIWYHYKGGWKPSQRDLDTRTYCVGVLDDNLKFRYETTIDESQIVGKLER